MWTPLLRLLSVLKRVPYIFYCLRRKAGKIEKKKQKQLTIIKVEQRHFFLFFLALFLERLGRRFRFSRLENKEKLSRIDAVHAAV